MKTHRFKTYILCGVAVIGLSACGATPKQYHNHEYTTTNIHTQINTAIERAAEKAIDENRPMEGLVYFERLYKRQPESPKAAMDYARVLNTIGEETLADMVLAPHAEQGDAPAELLIEYAKMQLQKGRYSETERLAARALQQKDHYKAYQLLGITLDSQGFHSAAEQAFREALNHWEGNPSGLLNNLALNLASQKKLEDAYDMISLAREHNPDHPSIAKNYEMITELQEQQERG